MHKFIIVHIYDIDLFIFAFQSVAQKDILYEVT